MPDLIFESFLAQQEQDARALSAESDLVVVEPIGPSPADRYLVEFTCKGLVERDPGHVEEADHFVVGIWFPSTYLREANPFRVTTWLDPRRIWHPNVSMTLPIICIGRLMPGTSLVDIVYQVFEVITWNKVTMRDDDALNRAACQWARANRDRFPVDRRPLKRHEVAFEAIDRESPKGDGTHGN
jgi:hypothetical protein